MYLSSETEEVGSCTKIVQDSLVLDEVYEIA